MIEVIWFMAIAWFGSKKSSISFGLVGLGVSVWCLVNPPAGRPANLPEPYASIVSGIGIGIALLGGIGMMIFGPINIDKAGL